MRDDIKSFGGVPRQRRLFQAGADEFRRLPTDFVVHHMLEGGPYLRIFGQHPLVTDDGFEDRPRHGARRAVVEINESFFQYMLLSDETPKLFILLRGGLAQVSDGR